MIQALSVHVLGPGVVVFGAGPDGGREATFDGTVAFPSTADQWEGYIIIQAKCREKLRNNSQDADWLINQLRHDLDKFLDRKRRLRKPQYYIAATNVTLSPEARGGGKTKVEALFKTYLRRLRLKGDSIWAADELRAYLENAEDVRKSYTAWLTPSAGLARLIKNLERPNLERLLPLALARDLRNERDVRLRDAGQETETPIFLDDVFIDLPVSVPRFTRAIALPSLEEIEEDPEGGPVPSGLDETGRVGVVSRLLTRAKDKLDPEAIEHAATSFSGGRVSRQLINRIVILGGPGQGKSTVGHSW